MEGDGEGPRRPATRRKDRGFGGKRGIRFDLESTSFQTELGDDSIREKEEEIEKIISPLSIRPEKERRGRIWKETAVACARVSGGSGGARRTWPTGPREREREGFGAAFGPKPKEDF